MAEKPKEIEVDMDLEDWTEPPSSPLSSLGEAEGQDPENSW